MNSKQKEAVQRITAQYVAEVHAGHKSQVSTYLARYPQYANEIADYIAYFHAFEEDVPIEAHAVPALSAKFRIAIESATARIAEEQLHANNELPTHLPQVAEASGPYQLNQPSAEQSQELTE
jgi:hypothetical protein